MAVETLKSTTITNLDTIPPVANTIGEGGPGFLRNVGDYATPSAAASVTSKYLLARVPSNAKVKAITFESEAQGAGKFDIGAYYSDSTKDGTAVANQGVVIDQDFFATAVDAASAVSRTDVTNESGTYTADKRNQPLWQALGLSSDPGGFIDIAATVVTTAVTTGTGKIRVDVAYVV